MSDPILELLAAPPNPSMRVDETAVHAGGRRRVRQRATRRGALGLVGVVGAAAIAFAALGTGADRDALPAGPSPSQGTAERVSAEVLDGRYAVEVVPGAPSGQPNVIFYAVRDGQRQQLAGSDATPDVVSMGTGSGADGVMLGTAPASATDFLTLTREGASGHSMDQQLLPGTDFQAVALEFDTPSDTEKYVGTVWMDDKGDSEVRTAMGIRLPSAKLGDRDTVWVDRDSRHMGVFTPDGGSARPLGDDATTTLGFGQKDEKGGWSWSSITLLPADARDIDVTWAGADQHSAVLTESLSAEGGVVALSDARGPAGSQGPRVTSVTWTDEAGTRHTDAVE